MKVVMTAAAKHFITPLTLATLSRNPILTEFFNPENGQWNSHVSLGLWADLYLIAPASANTLSKMAHGIADNLLLTTYLSAKCPVMAAGLDGKGRMEEPDVIVRRIKSFFSRSGSLRGRRALVTSGPTREAIDPVRFISNHSSGKMASAIADELARRGADVTVVSGPAAVRYG